VEGLVWTLVARTAAVLLVFIVLLIAVGKSSSVRNLLASLSNAAQCQRAGLRGLFAHMAQSACMRLTDYKKSRLFSTAAITGPPRLLCLMATGCPGLGRARMGGHCHPSL